MATKPNGTPAKVDRVTFTRSSAGRIARVVRIVEAGDRDGKGLDFGVRLQQSNAGKSLRHVQWSGEWPAGETHAITFKVGGATATANNSFLGVNTGEGWAARSSSAWHLVVADLSLQPGWNTTEIQLFGHSSTDGIAQWYSITTCATATA